MASDADVFADLAGVFGHLGIRWYLFGGQAAILHGATRFTEDVDVTVDLGSHSRASLLSALREGGFSARLADEAFIEQTRVMPMVHDASGTPVDVVLAGPGLEDMFFERVVRIVVEGQQVSVASAEDIAVMKILSGRPKDLEDVVAIIAAQAVSFDADRARELLGLLEEALDQSDLVSAFERCVTRAAPE